jgi:hypothetical protein
MTLPPTANWLSEVAPAVFLTPLDSGFYTIDCNRTYNPNGPD